MNRPIRKKYENGCRASGYSWKNESDHIEIDKATPIYLLPGGLSPGYLRLYGYIRNTFNFIIDYLFPASAIFILSSSGPNRHSLQRRYIFQNYWIESYIFLVQTTPGNCFLSIERLIGGGAFPPRIWSFVESVGQRSQIHSPYCISWATKEG